MTRVAVVADTHHSFRWLPLAAERLGKVDLLFHLGDFCADAETVSRELGGIPYDVVRGNNDAFSTEPKVRFEYVENARIMLTHGDEFYNTYHLAMRAEENHCSAVLFGHTHIPLLQASGNILILNPGSLSLPRRGSKPSCALLEVEGKDINITMISL
ncbi:MAG: metallophosphoesterase [Eubacteriales bacterium]|nr:metallophosphoesterase [Eubacteriales bacterium]